MSNNNYWYAKQENAEDFEWGDGTESAEEAREWLAAHPYGRICVVDDCGGNGDPVVIEEWKGEKFGESAD